MWLFPSVQSNVAYLKPLSATVLQITNRIMYRILPHPAQRANITGADPVSAYLSTHI